MYTILAKKLKRKKKGKKALGKNKKNEKLVCGNISVKVEAMEC